jgi:carboxymethylenebutenolidase
MTTPRWIVFMFALISSLILSACASSTPLPGVSGPSPVPSDEATEPVTETSASETAAPESIEPAGPLASSGHDVNIKSGGKAYESYLAAPVAGGPYSAIVLIHSFRGLEQGYRTMVDRVAAHGFVVLALGWQTYEQSPSDEVVKQLVIDGVAVLQARPDVNPDRIGLTGFCAGGRYTMLLLPQIKSFKAGVAWYGFPYQGNPSPSSLINDLDAPMLIIHGTADSASPIADINRYTDELKAAGKTYDLKVYEGEPHGFMIAGGQLNESANAVDALDQMLAFFTRELG